MNDESDMTILGRGELPELLYDLVLMKKLVKCRPSPRSHHELHIVNNDVADVVDVDRVAHGVHHFGHVVGPMERREVEWQLGELIRPVVELGQILLQVDQAELFHHGAEKPDIANLETSPQSIHTWEKIIRR